MTHADEPRPSIFALARQLVGGVVKLAKLELAQGRQEIGEMLSTTLTGVIMFAVAFGIVVLVVLMAVGFALPAYLGFNAAWLSALFVFVVQLLLAGVFVARGIRHVRIGPPEQTLASVKEDIAWAKRLLRRG